MAISLIILKSERCATIRHFNDNRFIDFTTQAESYYKAPNFRET